MPADEDNQADPHRARGAKASRRFLRYRDGVVRHRDRCIRFTLHHGRTSPFSGCTVSRTSPSIRAAPPRERSQVRTWTGRLFRNSREWIRRWHHSHSGRGGQRACSPIVTAPPSQKARTRAQLDRGRHAAVPCRLAARVPMDSVRPASGWPARRHFRRIPTRAISGCRRRWSGPGASPSPGSSARSGGRCRRRRAASWVWTRHCATPPGACTASPASVQALHHGFQWIAERLNRVPGFVFECP